MSRHLRQPTGSVNLAFACTQAHHLLRQPTICCASPGKKPPTICCGRSSATSLVTTTRPGQTSGRVEFGSGQGRVTGRIGRPAPDPYLSPGRVGLARAPCAGVSGRVFFGLGRVFWPLGRVFRVGSGFGSKITARARPVDCCGSKNTARAHPPRSSGRVGSGFFGRVGLGLSGRAARDQV